MTNTRPGLIGRKIGMTQLFDRTGDLIPVTAIELGPNSVLQVKKADGRDGYDGVQLGFGTQKPQRLTKPERGHFEKHGVAVARVLREIRLDPKDLALYPKGSEVRIADLFKEGERVDVVGVSKGSGFSGVMKRHHFAGFQRSHGEHEYFRHGGSIGTRLQPGMVFKGVRMPGQLGAARVTVQNLKLYRMDSEKNIIFVAGGVPGAPGSFVIVRKAVRAPRGKKAAS
jgi:large subunit ribosomal protein L3